MGLVREFSDTQENQELESPARAALLYGAAAILTAVGVSFWLALPQSAPGEVAAVSSSVVRVGVVLTLMLGLVTITTIRLTLSCCSRRNRLARLEAELEAGKRHVELALGRLKMMFTANPNPMWIYDVSTLAFVDVNDAMVQEYGYSRDELLEMSIKDIRPPASIQALVDDIGSFGPGQSRRGTWIHRRKDGSELCAEITGFKYEREGRLCCLVLAHDVTQRVHTEEELRRSQACLQSLIDNAPFGICRGSVEGDRFVMVNNAFSEIMGYSCDELLRMAISQKLYEVPSERARALDLLRHNGKMRGFETKMIRSDGRRVPVRLSGALTHQGRDGEAFFEGYVEDLTEQNSLEEQIRRVQKLEAVGRLAGGIAHDFNNILVVIKLSTEMMLGQVTPESPLCKPLLQVSQAADRASALTRQMLAFGRRQMMQIRTLNINSVVTDVSRMLRRIIGEDVHLVTRLDEDLACTRLDSDQLAQVLMNLAVNARDAMPEGGTLHIQTANVDLDNFYVREHPPVQPGRYVMLAVTDSGTGIDKAALPQIFDPFFTTKEVGKGTGLGLAIVYGIVKQSDGYIWVYSEAGQGTTFKLYFPSTSDVPEQPHAASEIKIGTSGARVLLVDDDVTVRRNVSECLQSLGYEVEEADGGASALEFCELNRGNVDLLLTDLVMPGMNGHQLASLFGERYPDVRVLFMSGYTDDNAIRRDILLRGSPFVQKPFSVAELAGAIERVLESSAPLAAV